MIEIMLLALGTQENGEPQVLLSQRRRVAILPRVGDMVLLGMGDQHSVWEVESFWHNYRDGNQEYIVAIRAAEDSELPR